MSKVSEKLIVEDALGGEIGLSDETYVSSIKPPLSLSSNLEFFLPSSNGLTNQVLTKTATGTDWANMASGGGNENLWIIKNVLSTGTNGGTIDKNVWTTRPINTLDKLPSVGTEVTISSNQITITAGKYLFKCLFPIYHWKNTARLRNITDSSTTTTGMTGYYGVICLVCLIDISSTKVFEIQQYSTVKQTNTGLGRAMGVSGQSEIYLSAVFTKLD